MTTKAIATLILILVVSSCKKDNSKVQNECGAQSLSGNEKDVKWNHNNIKWFCTRWCSTLSEQETRDVFKYCFQQYSSVANITFTESTSPYDADIVISFLDDRTHYISHLNYMKCPTNFNYNIFPEYGHAFLPYSNPSFS